MKYILAEEKAYNALVYFAERIKPLYLSNAMKLLYMSDEQAIKETGVPITWLDYKAWKFGPVPEDIYNKVKQVDDLQKLENGDGTIYNLKISDSLADLTEDLVLNPVKPFNDDEFSDYEIGVLQSVVDKYGKLTSEQFVNMLHQKGTLWHKVVQANNLQQQFELKSNRSDYVIEFTNLLDTDYKKAAFEVAYQSHLM
jgi:uncharacterized phage-associated protein